MIGSVNILAAEDLGTGVKCKWPQKRWLGETAACGLDSKRSKEEQNDLYFAKAKLVINERQEQTNLYLCTCAFIVSLLVAKPIIYLEIIREY